jgi:hypothetical protein
MIDKGRGWSEYLEYLVYGYIPTPPHDSIWRSQREARKENGRRMKRRTLENNATD